ncbi:MAG: right-handed parallel beta-helix repeat-containing protein, partial [Candidatus Hydrogenedentes bacterium]|nr:right-handed parallel beta-helix repeat-containing protein [Candidatus Hydrogenedentota bacterium]
MFSLIFSIALTTVGLDLHVTPGGNAANPGTEAAPVGTLDQARDALRTQRASGDTSAATVFIHPGAYRLEHPFTLGAEDSNTVYTAEPDTVRLYGGCELPADAFAPVTDAAALARIPEEAHAATREVDLKALGVTEVGSVPGGFESAPALPEVFFNDERMQPAHWPNEGWAEIESVVESGPAPWRNFESDKPGTFTYSGDRPARWTAAPEVWLEGYWCFDWSCETIRIGKIDPGQKRITLAENHNYGIGHGNPAPRRYRAIYLLEELDMPGEYYIDREQGILYFWPPGALEGSRVVLSLLTEPLIQLKDVANVKLSGFTIEATAGNGVRVEGGSGVTLEDCAVRNIGQDGVVVDGGESHLVQRCDIHDTGMAGLHMGGGDRKTLRPSKHAALHNHIHHISRRMRTHAYNVHMSGVGVRLAHNEINDAPHQAIGLGGNDHIIEYNEIHHAGMDSDDCGAFYMGRNPSERGNVIRYNYWHHVGSEFAHGSCAVYFDDGTGGQQVYGNVFYKAAGGNFGAVFIHGGHDNLVTNNIFIDCSRAIGAAPWSAAM